MRRANGLSLLFLASFVILVTGCSKKRTASTSPTPVASAANADRARRDSMELAAAAAERRAGEERARAAREADQAARETIRQTLVTAIYFELDRSELTEEGRSILDAKLDVMQRQPEVRIRIEGHADDTGSDEYNMALGERRGAVASRYLTQGGIAAGRIQIVSRGEERPVCTAREESCRARNRRDEFVIVSGL